MTTAFHAWLYGRFIEIQSNVRRKELYGTNQGSNFLGGSFHNRVQELQFNLEETVNPSILKDAFSLRTDPSIFTSIAPVLLDWSDEANWFFPAEGSGGQKGQFYLIGSRYLFSFSWSPFEWWYHNSNTLSSGCFITLNSLSPHLLLLGRLKLNLILLDQLRLA